MNRRQREYWQANRERKNANQNARRLANLPAYSERAKGYFQAARLNTPAKVLINGVRSRAGAKKIPFDLTYEWALARWTGRCELTGIEFVLGQPAPGPKPLSPSIDRIEPALGYVQSNCRFIIHAVNALKGIMTDDQMYEVAVALISHRTK